MGMKIGGGRGRGEPNRRGIDGVKADLAEKGFGRK